MCVCDDDGGEKEERGGGGEGRGLLACVGGMRWDGGDCRS